MRETNRHFFLIINLRYVVPLLFGLTLLSCEKNQLSSHHQLRRAPPANSKDVGVLVQGVNENEVVHLLNENPQARARVISHQHKVYEIFSVEEKDLEKRWPKIEKTKNQFFSFHQSRPSPKTMDEKFRLLNAPSDLDSAKEQKLRPCLENEEAPIASIDVSKNGEAFVADTIDLGNSLQFSAKSSLSHDKHPSSLKMGWVVSAPKGSLQEQQIFFSENVDYKPDAYGSYTVILVVQDDRYVCSGTQFEFVVIGNQEYVGQNHDVTKLFNEVDKSIFKHYEELDLERIHRETVSQGEGITIGVIDSGVNYNHLALSNNMWVNEKEIPNNQIDDDGNGTIDDVVGYDFANSDPWPFDDQGHGSHVSGLAASPLFGVAPKAKIMALKAMTPSGGDIASIVGAIYYGVDNGAKILNMSFGSHLVHPLLQKAMDYTQEKNVLVVAASGNGDPFSGVGLNIDLIPFSPAALPNENIVSVAAKDSSHLLAPYSNYGIENVDVVAPGGNPPDDLLMSTYLYNPAGIQFFGSAGTSMAAPIVSGIAALVWSTNPKLNTQDVKQILLQSGKKVEGLETMVKSGRYLNAWEAVTAAKSSL